MAQRSLALRLKQLNQKLRLLRQQLHQCRQTALPEEIAEAWDARKLAEAMRREVVAVLAGGESDVAVAVGRFLRRCRSEEVLVWRLRAGKARVRALKGRQNVRLGTLWGSGRSGRAQPWGLRGRSRLRRG